MATDEHVIQVCDLRRPELTYAHLQELDYWDRHPVDLSENAILEAAKLQTGLDDFGIADFRERLRSQIDEIDATPGLTSLGRAEFYRKNVRYASNRLRLVDLLKRHPKILETSIQDPIVVVGPPRSSTTHLVNLLAADSRLRSLRTWEALEPIAVSDEEWTQDGVEPRYIRCKEEWEWMQTLLPHIAAMQPVLDPDQVYADEEILGPNFPTKLTDFSADRATVPYGHRDAEIELHYQFLESMLKALQWQRGPHKWLLRGHFHAANLDTLLSHFPGATIVMTVRDPVAMIKSSALLFSYTTRMNTREIDMASFIDNLVDSTEFLLRAGIRNRQYVAKDKLVDVEFDEFMSDKLGVVERIYAAAGLKLTDEQRDSMTSFLAGHTRGRNGRVVSDLQADFDVDANRLRERFRFYYEQFPGLNSGA